MLEKIWREGLKGAVQRARSMFHWGMVLVDTTVLGSSVIVLSPWDQDGFLSDHVGRFWSRLNLKMVGVDVEVEGLDRLDPAASYVLMVNHSSMLDIWVIYDVLPRQIRWVMKSELRKVPVFGYACEKMGHVYVERGSSASAKASMDVAARKVSAGASVVFFPEGTRSTDGSMLPFKKGGFRLAIEAGVPVVPIAVKGTRDLMPSGDWVCRKGHAKAEILTPIPTDGLTLDELPVLMSKTRLAIDEALEQ